MSQKMAKEITRQLVFPLTLAVILSGCVSTPPSPPCDPALAWKAGLKGNTIQAECDASLQRLWQEASNLGLELQRLMGEQKLLLAEKDNANTSGSSLKAARLQREIDQIQGAAQLRGWPLPNAASALFK